MLNQDWSVVSHRGQPWGLFHCLCATSWHKCSLCYLVAEALAWARHYPASFHTRCQAGCFSSVCSGARDRDRLDCWQHSCSFQIWGSPEREPWPMTEATLRSRESERFLHSVFTNLSAIGQDLLPFEGKVRVRGPGREMSVSWEHLEPRHELLSCGRTQWLHRKNRHKCTCECNRIITASTHTDQPETGPVLQPAESFFIPLTFRLGCTTARYPHQLQQNMTADGGWVRAADQNDGFTFAISQNLPI